jgi:hypothetical protein
VSGYSSGENLKIFLKQYFHRMSKNNVAAMRKFSSTLGLMALINEAMGLAL